MAESSSSNADRFDLVVIGSGPAGEKGANQAAYFGHRVAVVERRSQPGGAAIAVSGVPVKALRDTAVYLTGWSRRDVYGVGVSETVLSIEALPQHLMVVGGGPVGSEYASVFAALGAEVTLVDRGTRLLPLLDGELSEALAQSLRRSGARLMLGAQVESVERDDKGLIVRVDGDVLRPEVVLHAVGRAGNVEGLGLAEAGVEADDRGRVRVDRNFQTTAEGVYAAGDITGPPGLASVAMEQARVAMCRAFGIPFKQSLDPVVPTGIYTLPEASMVGLTEEAARAAGEDVETGRSFFGTNARALIAGSTEGLVKLVFRASSRQLVGAHILGEEATELIHVAQAVLHEGGTTDEFIDTTFNFPTRADAYKYAAYDGLQRLQGRASG